MRLFITIIVTLLTSTSYAKISNIHCHDIETMHQSANAIYDAAHINDSYMATTQPFAIHTAEMGWFAVVYNIQALSISDAINKGRTAMLSITTQSSTMAEDLAGIYVCRYDAGKIEV